MRFSLLMAGSEERLGQVVQVLLIGVGAVAGLAAIVVLAHFFGQAFNWMVEKRWPVGVYVAAALGVIVGGYIADSPAMYYGIGALVLPLLVLMLLAIVGF